MNKRRYSRAVLALIATFLIVLAAPRFALTQQVGPAAPQQNVHTTDPNVSYQLLKNVADAVAWGDFEQARRQLDQLGSAEAYSSNARALQQLLNQHDKLSVRLEQAYLDAYQEHLRNMHLAVQNARWRNAILQTSKTYQFDSDEKKKLEQELHRKVQDHWLTALAQLTLAEDLAERTALNRTLDPNLRDQIIRHALEIAASLQDNQQWLRASNEVYSYLLALDKTNRQYEKTQRRLLRRALIDQMYAPDPNKEHVTWQEHRKDVSFNIIATALAALNAGYVEQPNFQKMAQRAFENCLLLVDSKKLHQTFQTLNDTEAVNIYRESVQLLADIAASMSPEELGYYRILIFLKKLLKINQQTVNLPEEVIMAEFADGAFAALDGYTYIVWPGDVKEFRKDMTNEFFGVGIVINRVNGKLTVDSLLSKDAPAYLAGLDAGDIITHIDGTNTDNITLEMAVKLITGEPETDVVLTIEREGFDQPRDFTVTRRQVVVQTVKGLCRDAHGNWIYLLDPNDGIAYVRLAGFSGDTPTNLRKTLEKLREQNMRALVLDLRYNSGGFLSGAVNVVDTFISEGLIVSSRYRPPGQEDYYATEKNTFDPDLPLVVLINAVSASASEIVSGALKDHKRALIVGTRSYGKGNVQTIHKLRGSNAQMKMSIAYYYLPSNRRVHRDPTDRANQDYGVEPHVNVELTGEQRQEYLNIRRNAGVLYRDDLPPQQQNRTVYSPADILESDLQLQMALVSLRARLLERTLRPHNPQQLVGLTARKP